MHPCQDLWWGRVPKTPHLDSPPAHWKKSPWQRNVLNSFLLPAADSPAGILTLGLVTMG